MGLCRAVCGVVLALMVVVVDGGSAVQHWGFSHLQCVRFVDTDSLPAGLPPPPFVFVSPGAAAGKHPAAAAVTGVFYTIRGDETSACSTVSTHGTALDWMYLGELREASGDALAAPRLVVAFASPERHGPAMGLHHGLSQLGFDVMVLFSPPPYVLTAVTHVLVDTGPNAWQLHDDYRPDVAFLNTDGHHPPRRLARSSASLQQLQGLDLVCDTVGRVAAGSLAEAARNPTAVAVEAASGTGCLCMGTHCFHPWALHPGLPQSSPAQSLRYIAFVSMPFYYNTLEELSSSEGAAAATAGTAIPSGLSDSDALNWVHQQVVSALHDPPSPSWLAFQRREQGRLLLALSQPSPAGPLDVWASRSTVRALIGTVQAFSVRPPVSPAIVFPTATAAAPSEATISALTTIQRHHLAASPLWLTPTDRMDVLVVLPPAATAAGCPSLPSLSQSLSNLPGTLYAIVRSDALTSAQLVAATHPAMCTAVLLASCHPAEATDMALASVLLANGRHVGVAVGEVLSDDDLYYALEKDVFAYQLDPHLPSWLQSLHRKRWTSLGGGKALSDEPQAGLAARHAAFASLENARIPQFRTRRHAAGDADIRGGGPVYVPPDSPDPSRLKVVLAAVAAVSAQNYLEIGCNDDFTFSRVAVPGIKIGVDPDQGGTHRMSSDEFFDRLRSGNVTLSPDDGGGRSRGQHPPHHLQFDVVFVDGLHEYRQVVRDVNNALTVLSPGGVIVLHDLSPRDEHEAGTDFHTVYWNGDVWRAAVAIRHSPAVNLVTGDFDQGVGVLRVGPNAAPLDPSVPDADTITFGEFDARRQHILQLKTYDEVVAALHSLTFDVDM